MHTHGAAREAYGSHQDGYQRTNACYAPARIIMLWLSSGSNKKENTSACAMEAQQPNSKTSWREDDILAGHEGTQYRQLAQGGEWVIIEPLPFPSVPSSFPPPIAWHRARYTWHTNIAGAGISLARAVVPQC